MAENVLKLKKQAVAAGMPRNDAVKATRAQLEKFIAEAGSAKSSTKKTGKKKTTKTEKPAVTKKTGKKKTGKKTKTEKAAPAKSSKKTTKTKTAKPKAKKSDSDAGRNLISSLDWSAESDEWNPRAGGATEKMFKALKKSKGDVDKAFDLLSDDMFEYVGKKKRNGDKRTKAEAEAMLRYRLNRTKYEFAIRTGQHESATNRVEYGTGATASAKPKSKKTTTAKSSTKKTTSTKAKKGKKKSKK